MSKAILVIDMPSGCSKCEFCLEIAENHHVCQRVSDNNERCKRIDYDVDFYQYEKPNWCPLKPMPNKIGIASALKMPREGCIIDVINSYNACIDEILKGSE